MVIKARKSKIQAEGKAHNADVLIADKAVAAVTAVGKAHKAVDLETKGHEGTKRTRKRKSVGVTYPLKAFVNEYGFMRFSKDLLEDLGFPLKTKVNLKITQTENGILVERA